MAGVSKSRPNDARAKRSRAALQKAMLAMVEKESFEQLSIRSLCLEAKVSHPTFYRNYSSKEQILGEIAAAEIQKLWERMLPLVDLRDPYKTALAICNYVGEKRKLWTILVTTSASAVVRDEYVRLARMLAQTREQFNPDFPNSMISAFFAAGMIEILAWWLRQPEDYPMDYVAQFLARLVLEPTIGPDTFQLKKHG